MGFNLGRAPIVAIGPKDTQAGPQT